MVYKITKNGIKTIDNQVLETQQQVLIVSSYNENLNIDSKRFVTELDFSTFALTTTPIVLNVSNNICDEYDSIFTNVIDNDNANICVNAYNILNGSFKISLFLKNGSETFNGSIKIQLNILT